MLQINLRKLRNNFRHLESISSLYFNIYFHFIGSMPLKRRLYLFANAFKKNTCNFYRNVNLLITNVVEVHIVKR